jgi:diacylglycerol kinase (ATP)
MKARSRGRPAYGGYGTRFTIRGPDCARPYNAEDAFRQELLLAAVLVPLALLLSPNGAGLALMIGSLLLVLIVELLNSAIEAVVDRVSLEQHPLAKRAKDIGSAAVLLALLNVGVVWACVLFG